MERLGSVSSKATDGGSHKSPEIFVGFPLLYTHCIVVKKAAGICADLLRVNVNDLAGAL